MSILETRRVVMDEEEIRSASMNCRDLRDALRVPVGNVDAIEFLPDECRVTFVVASDMTTIGAEGLIALLVANCRRLGIPIPRTGAKICGSSQTLSL